MATGPGILGAFRVGGLAYVVDVVPSCRSIPLRFGGKGIALNNLTVSDFFRLNGIDKAVDQERILESIQARVPSILWGSVQLTAQQKAVLGKLHGYRVEEPPPQGQFKKPEH